MTIEASNGAYHEFAVHESRQVLRDIMGDDGKVDVERPHPPLLFVGAEKDEIIPNTLVARIAESYTDQRSHSEYVKFSSRGHFISGQNGWEKVALRVEKWLESHLAAVRS